MSAWNHSSAAHKFWNDFSENNRLSESRRFYKYVVISPKSVFTLADDVKDEPKSEQPGNEISNDTQRRKSEQKGTNPGRDNHWRADNHGGDNDAEGQAVGDVIEGFPQTAEIFVPEPQCKLPPVCLVQNL